MTRSSTKPVLCLCAVLAAFAGLPIAQAVARTATRLAAVRTIELPAYGGEIAPADYGYAGSPRASVLLPAGYDPARRYPLLLLLSGHASNYRWWLHYAHAAEVLKGLNAIVVMPEGAAGWYMNWWNNGKRAHPAWENYMLDEVVPQIIKRYPILPERRYHAVVGVSMGGMGATYLAGRLPGFFGAVASISGWLDYEAPPGFGPGMALTSGSKDPLAVVGPQNGFYALGHNPSSLVRNLANTRVFVAAGSGKLSPRGFEPGNGPNVPTAEATEVIVRTMSEDFVAAAKAAKVPVTSDFYTGIHDAPDFDYALAKIRAWGLFKPVATNPSRWINDTVATQGTLWDVRYGMKPAPDGIVRFRRTAHMLDVSGAHTTVTLRFANGCTVRSELPVRIRIPAAACRHHGTRASG